MFVRFGTNEVGTHRRPCALERTRSGRADVYVFGTNQNERGRSTRLFMCFVGGPNAVRGSWAVEHAVLVSER
eukprot:926277-Alexandrium_andersonii.AAC.1